MNSKTVADAIAGRFIGVTATNGGVTEGFAVAPTASLPNSLARGPALFVYHPTGVLDVGVSKLRLDMLDYTARFLRDPMDYPARSDWLYAWYDALRDRVEMDIDLSLSYVAWARPVEAKIELDGWDYAKVTYDLIELIVRVRFNEVVTTIN
jgi:hypothetical protein